MEATCVHMFLKGDAKRQRDDFTDVALSQYAESESKALSLNFLRLKPGLPFQGEVNTGFGVLAKVYIDATIAFYQGMPEGEPDQAEVKAAKEQAFEVIEETFVVVKTPKLEIERGFRFWDAVSYMLLLKSYVESVLILVGLLVAHGIDPCDRKGTGS
jgi:hypothetical protein